MERRYLCALAATALLAAPQTLRAAAEEAPAGIRVLVSIMPQAWFVERIGGSAVRVDVLVRPGQSPHTFEPTPRQVAGLADAQVYFPIGLPFEKPLLGKIAAVNKDLKVADVRKGIKLRAITGDEARHHAEESEAEAREPAGGKPAEAGHAADGHEVHAHGAKGHKEHAHAAGGHEDHAHAAGDPDPHFWLNPRLAAIMAANICAELSRLDPARAAEFAKNLEAVKAELDRVDRKIAKALAPLKGREFFVFHSAFGYFGDAYGLRQVTVETGGKEPGARQLASLIDRAREAGVKVIFVQPQFSRKSAEALAAEIGGVVVPMDPLGREYLKNLEDIAEKVGRALAPEGEGAPAAAEAAPGG